MNQTNTVLLAAGLPALIASGTYAVGQVIGAISTTRSQRIKAVIRVMESLERIPKKALSPPLSQVFSHPELDIAAQVNRLLITLPRRDQFLWDWLQLKVNELVNANKVRKVEISAEMQGTLTAWLSSRRRTRKHIKGELAKVPNQIAKLNLK